MAPEGTIDIHLRAREILDEWEVIDLIEATKSTSLIDLAPYIPYVLATIYYAWGIGSKIRGASNSRTIEREMSLWLSETVDQVMTYVPEDDGNENRCRQDLEHIAKALAGFYSASDSMKLVDIVSDRIFTTMKTYYPAAGKKERDLVDYVVKAELEKLT